MQDDYSLAIARKVVAQLAEAMGYDSAQESAVEILAGILLRYMTQLCCSAHSYAELAGRTKMNVIDLLLVMEEMNVDLDNLYRYVTEQEDIPFAHSTTSYPITKHVKGQPSFAANKEVPPPHIPSFLPAFPDKHTWVHTPMYQSSKGDLRQQKEAAAAARQQGEHALVQLQQRLLQAQRGEGGHDNPFLIQPELQGPSTSPRTSTLAAGTRLAQQAGGSLPRPAPAGDDDVVMADAQPPPQGMPTDTEGPDELQAAQARLRLDAASSALQSVVGVEDETVGWQPTSTGGNEQLDKEPLVLQLGATNYPARAKARAVGFSSQKPVINAFQTEERELKSVMGRRRKSSYARNTDPKQQQALEILGGGYLETED